MDYEYMCISKWIIWLVIFSCSRARKQQTICSLPLVWYGASINRELTYAGEYWHRLFRQFLEKTQRDTTWSCVQRMGVSSSPSSLRRPREMSSGPVAMYGLNMGICSSTSSLRRCGEMSSGHVAEYGCKLFSQFFEEMWRDAIWSCGWVWV